MTYVRDNCSQQPINYEEIEPATEIVVIVGFNWFVANYQVGDLWPDSRRFEVPTWLATLTLVPFGIQTKIFATGNHFQI